MMASRKAVLDKNKQQLLDSVNASNKIYTNEELSILLTEQQELIEKQNIMISEQNEKLNLFTSNVYSKEEIDAMRETDISGFVKTIDLRSGYDVNTWYPVVGNFSQYKYPGYRRVRCHIRLGDSGKPNWSTHASGFSVSLDLMSQAGEWGGFPARTIVLANDNSFTTSSPVGYRNFSEISANVFYLRGGGKYNLYTEHPTNWTIYTSKHVFDSQYNLYVEPQTSNPGITATGGVVTLK